MTLRGIAAKKLYVYGRKYRLSSYPRFGFLLKTLLFMNVYINEVYINEIYIKELLYCANNDLPFNELRLH